MQESGVKHKFFVIEGRPDADQDLVCKEAIDIQLDSFEVLITKDISDTIDKLKM